MAIQKWTVTPTGATSTGLAIHFLDGHTVHYNQGDIVYLVFDGTLPTSGDPTIANPDPVFAGGGQDGSEQ